MSGYIFHEREPITRDQKVALVGAILTSILLFVSAISATKWAAAWLKNLDFGILPLGILQFVLGMTYLTGRDSSDPSSRPFANSPRVRLIMAVMCFILGTAIVAVWFMTRGGAR